MGLRNILLFTSIIIIGFCLSLYFQTRQELDRVNGEEYRAIDFAAEKSHSLAEFNVNINPYNLEDIIQEILEKNRLAGEKTRVMEIGAGNGRTLMELKKLFPEVEFYAINKEKTHSFYRRENFLLTALNFELFNKQELENIELPYLVFQDLDFGNPIPYDNEKFDVIFSYNVMSGIKYKFELWNEVLRVLKPDGLSFHTDVNGINIYMKGLILDLRDALAEIRRSGIEINTLETKTSIRFKKTSANRSFPLIPHQPIPESTENLGQELRRPEMGYNLNL